MVDWPEGKFSQASTIEVPFLGLNIVPEAVEIGTPNLRRGLAEFTKWVQSDRGRNRGRDSVIVTQFQRQSRPT